MPIDGSVLTQNMNIGFSLVDISSPTFEPHSFSVCLYQFYIVNLHQNKEILAGFGRNTALLSDKKLSRPLAFQTVHSLNPLNNLDQFTALWEFCSLKWFSVNAFWSSNNVKQNPNN